MRRRRGRKRGREDEEEEGRREEKEGEETVFSKFVVTNPRTSSSVLMTLEMSTIIL